MSRNLIHVIKDMLGLIFPYNFVKRPRDRFHFSVVV